MVTFVEVVKQETPRLVVMHRRTDTDDQFQ